jgi:hypothetical protein
LRFAAGSAGRSSIVGLGVSWIVVLVGGVDGIVVDIAGTLELEVVSGN